MPRSRAVGVAGYTPAALASLTAAVSSVAAGIAVGRPVASQTAAVSATGPVALGVAVAVTSTTPMSSATTADLRAGVAVSSTTDVSSGALGGYTLRRPFASRTDAVTVQDAAIGAGVTVSQRSDTVSTTLSVAIDAGPPPPPLPTVLDLTVAVPTFGLVVDVPQLTLEIT